MKAVWYQRNGPAREVLQCGDIPDPVILVARREGRPGFLLGDLTGLGKTLSVWAALGEMPDDDILVVCPKGGCRSGAEPWR